tara:strand:- start:4622 stop:4882 length:261 start_codon:yes stop_codon:yes gene_type:complete
MKKYLIKLKSLLTKTPEREFTWTVEDFEAAKKWAKCHPDPDNPSRTLWERAYSPNWNESAYILAEINKEIQKEMKVKEIKTHTNEK